MLFRSYLHSEGPLIASLGVSDLVIVATGEMVLVAHRDHVGELDKLIERVKK